MNQSKFLKITISLFCALILVTQLDTFFSSSIIGTRFISREVILLARVLLVPLLFFYYFGKASQIFQYFRYCLFGNRRESIILLRLEKRSIVNSQLFLDCSFNF